MEEQTRNQYEFEKKAYDHIHLQIPKGDKERIQAHTRSMGESVNAFVKRAIRETIQRDMRRRSTF